MQKTSGKIKKYYHSDLAGGRWFELSFIAQMANVGAEVGRTINWREKDTRISKGAFYRALELLSLTKEDPKNGKHLKEIFQVYEMLINWFIENPSYHSTDEQWENYFYSFNYAVGLQRT